MALASSSSQDEPLIEGGFLRQFSMVYVVKHIRPLVLEESDDFDAVAEVDWAAGPAQAEFTG